MQQNNTLPAGFSFSQSSLQDYIDCPRRFQLRYLWELAWPAVETEPALEYERYVRRGVFFHQVVHQHLLGIAEERLNKMIGAFGANLESEDNELVQWWENYLTWRVWEKGSTFYPEISLSIPMGEFRLMAKYDLILVNDEGLVTIVDWKTSRKRPSSLYLKDRLQSKIYPYLVICAAEQFFGKEIKPEVVEMIYWFTNYPAQSECITYNSSGYMEDQVFVSDLVTEITGLELDEFPMTPRIEKCAYCAYRSFCNRGVGAGTLDELGEALETERGSGIKFDFEQVGEIEY